MLFRKSKTKTCSAKWDNNSCDRTDIVDNASGLCGGHYQQSIRRKGTIRAIRFYRPMGLSGLDLAEWFVNHATSTDKENECLNWNYAKNGDKGYPVASVPKDDGTNKRIGVHRYIAQWYLNSGIELLTQEVVHHKCSNRGCINPEHLQIVTASDNNVEMLERRVYMARILELEKEVDRLKELLEEAVEDVV